ncbi:MAG: hypothetical protein NTY38_12055 [Acidobacteria bacterium]|nr:hypothetical protein [Acidobacteriota bacterium]
MKAITLSFALAVCSLAAGAQAHRLARNTIRKTYEAGAAALLQHEIRYTPSVSPRVLPRIGHAILASFVTYDRHGRRVPHISRIGASFGTEYTSMQWMPARYRTNSRAARGVAFDLGNGSLMNVIREFTPELKRIFRKGRVPLASRPAVVAP